LSRIIILFKNIRLINPLNYTPIYPRMTTIQSPSFIILKELSVRRGESVFSFQFAAIDELIFTSEF